MLQALKALSVAKAKPKDKPYKLTDGGGLYLLVKAAGKYWRYDYRYLGKRKTLALGVFPTVSLEDAREIHQRATRELDLSNVDASATLSKHARSGAVLASQAHTLEAICREWREMQSKWAETHRSKVKLRLQNDVYPILGPREMPFGCCGWGIG